jgi:signal transduction histidine kinase
MSIPFNNHDSNKQSEKLNLDQNKSYKKQRKQKTRAVLSAASGFFIMALGLPFIEVISLNKWLMVIFSIATIWTGIFLILQFKLDSFLSFDPDFILLPAAASGILICVFIHIVPELRLLFLSGWYAVLLFGSGLLSAKNVITLSIFMGLAHIINIILLISLGENLNFINELGFLMPYVAMWIYISAVLEKVRIRRNEHKEMREMLSHLLIKKDQLLSDVSHELATPLTVLKLQVESLKDNIEEDVYATYDSLDKKLSELDHLINDIQLYSQSDSGALKLDFQEFNIKDALDEWQYELKMHVNTNNLTFKYINNLTEKLTIRADKNKFKQVLQNIIANSIKYTDNPGNIQLEAKVVNQRLNLIIEDSAPNIHDNHLKKIFERLYRVESSRNRETGGSGLGLAICKSLVEAHDGEIYAKQSLLGGLKIIIEFPVNQRG